MVKKMQEFNFWTHIKVWQKLLFLLTATCLTVFFLTTTGYFLWEKRYTGKIYPGVKIAGVDFEGKTLQEVEDFFQQKNSQINLDFTFTYQGELATLSARQISWGYNEKLIIAQALAFGRSNNFLADLYQKLKALKYGYAIPLSYSYDEAQLRTFLQKSAEKIDVPPQEALFQFANGRVTAFRPSVDGQAVDVETAVQVVSSTLPLLKEGALPPSVQIALMVKPVEPKVTTEKANNLGVKEFLGRGISRFSGSIVNRVHNIQLAASRLNGILVAPDEEFSFNKTLSDVSKFTGYKEAYIIKDGRTILGDGGGVCQVSTTFFRAILNAGLPILERHAHSYRVAYYEQGSPPGIDASVFDPQWDLKFKNDTGYYLLIQSSVDLKTATLTFDLYGTSDARTVDISKPVVKNEVSPPEDLYQDDPNLPRGEIKQVDWKAWGADVSFNRMVKRGDDVLINETFSSHYQPWQAVYLRGTKE